MADLNPAPYNPAFKVDFTPEGDTTSVATDKHIQEILRIYGLLNDLNVRKHNVSDFNAWVNQHVYSSDPHPNLNINNTVGNLPTERIDGLETLIDQKIDAIPEVPIATTEHRGIIEIATDAEAEAGTDTERAVTPAHLKKFAASGYYSASAGYYRLGQNTWKALVSVTATIPGKAAFIVTAKLNDGRDEDLYVRLYDSGAGTVLASTSQGWSDSGPIDVSLSGFGGNASASASTRTISLEARGNDSWGIDINSSSIQVWIV
jgi:hypothetical protein